MATESANEELKRRIYEALRNCPPHIRPDLNFLVSALNIGPGSPNRRAVEEALRSLIEEGGVRNCGDGTYEIAGEWTTPEGGSSIVIGNVQDIVDLQGGSAS